MSDDQRPGEPWPVAEAPLPSLREEPPPRGWRRWGLWRVIPRSMLLVLSLLVLPTAVVEVGLAWRWSSLHAAVHRIERWGNSVTPDSGVAVDVVRQPRPWLGPISRLAPLRDALEQFCPSLLYTPHIVAISLVGSQYDDAALQFAASRLPDVSQLRLEGCSVTSAGLRAIGQWRQLSVAQLVRLELDGPALAALGGLTELKTLEVECSAIDEAALRQFPALPNLRVLNLQKTGVRGTGLRGLANLPQLQNLHLQDEQLTDEALVELPVLPELKLLSVRSSRLTGRFLPRLRDLPTLTVLEIDGSPIDDEGLRCLPEHPALRGLFLVGSRVSGPGLAALDRLPALDDLSLAVAPVTDAGLQFLPELPKLLAFNLSGTKITPDCFPTLQGRCPALKTILVTVSEQMPQQALDDCESRHPQWASFSTWWTEERPLHEYWLELNCGQSSRESPPDPQPASPVRGH
jgi:hypothetical protein